MGSLKTWLRLTIVFFVVLIMDSKAKLMDKNKSETNGSAEAKVFKPDFKIPRKPTDGGAILFADELKVTLERYLFGICPHSFKMSLGRSKNSTATSMFCDLDKDQHDLAGRLATLSLRAHSAARADCSRLAAALANTLGELARTAADRQGFSSAAANTEANKKRKLSKSQKAKLQAKQRTALAVKKKAAAAAAAAAAKMSA